MTKKEIIAQLRRLDGDWRDAGANGKLCDRAVRDLAQWISENLDEICERLGERR